MCPHCNDDLPDSTEHTLEKCKAQEEDKSELLQKLKITKNELTLKSMAREMVRSKDSWIAAHIFPERVMYKKEEQERQFEAEALAGSNC